MMGRVGYRVRQFWQALAVRPLEEADWVAITAVLRPPEAALFQRFAHSDQRHSLYVLQTLQQIGQQHPDLLTAALLHDIGKICYPLWLWERVVIVLAKAFVPNKLSEWGQGEAVGWKRPFVVREQHPAWGADLAQQAGANALVVQLISRHQALLPEPLETEADRLLAQLQWADDQN